MTGVMSIGEVVTTRPFAAATRGFAAAEKSFSAGDSVTTTIYYNNETGSTQTRDVVVAFGSYNPDTKEFSVTSAIVIGTDESFSTGTGKTYTSGSWTIPDISGTFDVLVGLGTYNSSEGTFTGNAAEMLIKEDYISVTAAWVEITDFDIS